MIRRRVVFVAQVLLFAIAVSMLGDVIHAALHASMHARGPLRWPGMLHHAHHRFLDEQLAFHDERYWRNVAFHQIPELLMRTVLAFVVGVIVGLGPGVVGMATGLFAMECGMNLARRGRDRLHPVGRPVRAPGGGVFVDGAYHAHHHAFPDHFLSAHVQVVDRLLGRLLPLAGRDVVIVGGSRFCADLAAALEAEGSRVWRLAEDALDEGLITDADILVLGHGASRRDATSYEAILAAALARRARTLPLEVWAVGDDDAWGARREAFADRCLLRVLRRAPVPGAVRTLFWLKRGVRSL